MVIVNARQDTKLLSFGGIGIIDISYIVHYFACVLFLREYFHFLARGSLVVFWRSETDSGFSLVHENRGADILLNIQRGISQDFTRANKYLPYLS
jgi:hypothetical protein